MFWCLCLCVGVFTDLGGGYSVVRESLLYKSLCSWRRLLLPYVNRPAVHPVLLTNTLHRQTHKQFWVSYTCLCVSYDVSFHFEWYLVGGVRVVQSVKFCIDTASSEFIFWMKHLESQMHLDYPGYHWWWENVRTLISYVYTYPIKTLLHTNNRILCDTQKQTCRRLQRVRMHG